MIRFRTSAEVKKNRRVTLELPPETPLGQADLVITISPSRPADNSGTGQLRKSFGKFHSGDTHSADSERVDQDLASS